MNKPNVWYDFDYGDMSTHPSHKDFVIFTIEDQEHSDCGPYFSGDYMHDKFESDCGQLIDQRKVRKWMRPDPCELEVL